MSGTLTVTARPLRYGFLVDPMDSNSIRNAIQAASTLWGGSYGVIIPLFKNKPRKWDDISSRTKTIEKIVRGYIQAFDPDVFVLCTENTPSYFKELGIEVIPLEKVWLDDEEKDQAFIPLFGVGVFELLEEIYERHFRYAERYPLKLNFPDCSGELALFWSALYGEYPDSFKDRVNHFCSDAMDLAVTEQAGIELQAITTNLFPRRITQIDIETTSRSGYRDRNCVFFMDAKSNLDIIDYWNLRAIGRSVVPAPIQLLENATLKEMIVDFLKASRRPWSHNPQYFDTATFIRSRSTKMEDMQKYADGLKLNTATEHYYSLQHGYPRIWDEWARDKDAAEPGDLTCLLMKNVEVEGKPSVLSVPSIAPKFVNQLGRYGRIQCANEIEFRSYGGGEIFAQAYPKNPKENCLAAISHFSSIEKRWRVGKNGLVRLVKDDHSERWVIPSAEGVFLGWLKDSGWDAALSSAGMAAKQVANQLDGFISPLASETLVKLIEYMNGGGSGPVTGQRPTIEQRPIDVGEVRGRLAGNRSNNSLYELLIRQKVFKLGLTIQCPTCQKHSWYQLRTLDDKLECPKCLTNFSAVGHVDGGKWQFKTSGPLSIPNYAEGGVSVLLAINFLQHRLDRYRSKLTRCFSFEGKSKSGKTLEADFGMLWDQSTARGKYGGAIFGECKSYNDFEKKDVDKMRLIGEEFPGALLVFCTLKDTLTEKEKRIITALARWGRKYWKDELPRNPVMILTKHEIFDGLGPPGCWKALGADKKFARVHGDLYEIANATQQIHLGMDSWHDYWSSYFEKKREQRKRRRAATPANANPPQFS